MNDFIDKEKLLTVLRPENIVNSIYLILVDLLRPWLIKELLTKWCGFINIKIFII